MNIRHTYLNHGGGEQKPHTIIVHSMGQHIISDDGLTFDHAVKYLDDHGLSAHSLIDPEGINFRCRPDHLIAYHAKGHNTNTLGIEFLVPGDHDYSSFIETIKADYLTGAQYKEGLEQCKAWLSEYNIIRISRHSDIDPARKVDPGAGFPWQDFLNDLGFKNV